MSLTHSSSLRPAPCVLAAIVGLCAGLAQAQTSADSYNISHPFNLHTSGNIAPVVMLNYYEHAFARTNTCKDDQKEGPANVAIGAGVTTRTKTAGPVDSTSTANARANITTLVAGNVAGTISVFGSVTASVAGCPNPVPPRSYGRATAYSASAVSIRGQYQDSRGNIRWSGDWNNSGDIQGGTGRGVAKDPIRLKVNDLTTGVVSDYTLLSIHTTAGGGSTSWSGGVLSNSATDAVLDISLGAPGITVQQGHLRLVAVGGLVTESVATGFFAGSPVPPVGALPSFSMPLPEISIDFDAGANPNDDIETEMTLDDAGETAAEAATLADDGGNPLVTDLASGTDLANLSTPQNTDTGLGFSTGLTSFHVADDFTVPAGRTQLLSSLMLPLYQTGAAAGLPVLAVYVRVWANFPGPFSNLVAGDLTTNRLQDTNFFDVFRVAGDSPEDRSRAVNQCDVDLRWVPPLPPGHYWIEVATQSQVPGGAFIPPAVWRTEQDNAMQFNVQTGQWTQIQDPASHRTVSLPMQIFGDGGQTSTCYANCDGSATPPILNVLDFSCFLNRFAAGDAYANCDGSTTPPVLNVLDFSCFLNRFAAGCT